MILTNKLDLPQPFVDAATNDHEYMPKRYSVTAVLKGTREAILQRRHDGEIEQDVSDMVWAIFGSAVHGILEKSQETESQLKENWLSVDMDDGYELSGIFDLYDDSTGTVTDYKTAAAWKVVFGEFDDWKKQTMCYVWMLRQIGFENARRGEIVAMLKDHSKTKAKADHTYPQHPVFRIGWDFTDEELEECGKALKEKFAEIARCEQLPDDELPMCTEEERWHKADKWAVMKKGRKTAVRVYESEKDARVRAMEENKKADSNDLYYVEYREGEDTKCDSYCPVSDFCPFARAKKSDV